MQQGHSFESIAFLMRNAPKKGFLSHLNESLSEQKSSCLLSRKGRSSLNTCAQPPGELFITLLNVTDGAIIQVSSVWESNVIKKKRENKICLLIPVYEFYVLVLIIRAACSKKKILIVSL